MTPRVLILSSLYDFSTDLVALRLESASVPYLRLNREEFGDHRLTLDPLRCELKVCGPVGLHRVDSSLASIMFRQPVFLRNTPAVPLTAEEQLERSQWMGFLRGLSVFADAAWMNLPAATYLAESKPYQLAVASQCGFNVPETIVSNDATRIRQLFPDRLVVKSLDTVLLRDGEDCLFTYTILNPDAELTDATVQTVPLLAQRALEFKADLRVTVVGADVFAVRILCEGPRNSRRLADCSEGGSGISAFRTQSRPVSMLLDASPSPRPVIRCDRPRRVPGEHVLHRGQSNG